MRTLAIRFIPSARITLSVAEVTLLMQCSRHHSDGKCKAAGTPGGLIFGLNNLFGKGAPLRAKGDDYKGYEVKWRDLDTLSKVLEVARFFRDEKKANLAIDLSFDFKRLMDRMVDVIPKEIEYKRPDPALGPPVRINRH